VDETCRRISIDLSPEIGAELLDVLARAAKLPKLQAELKYGIDRSHRIPKLK
jgi:hypothetical protein